MGRKGNRQRNGLDRSSSNQKHDDIESTGASLSANKKGKSKVHDRKGADSEVSAGDLPSRSTSPSGERLSNTKCTGSGKKNKRSGNVSSGEKQENKASNISQPSDTQSQVREAAESDLQSDAAESRVDGGNMYACNNNLRDATSTDEGIPTENLMDDSRTLDAVVRRSLRIFVMYALKVTEGWLEQQKPRIEALTTALSYAHSYIYIKVHYAYPIIRTWVLAFGSLMLALSMIWIDCNIRGLDSLLRLGTTSFLTVLWCSILSVTAMIGIAKMLIILVIAAVVALFVGFAFALLIITVLAVAILWLYGSFWTTGCVIFLGGITLASRHERVALLVTTLYSMYCARSYTGWLGLLFGLNLAFISSDVLAHILKNVNESRSNVHPEGGQDKTGYFSGEPSPSSPVDVAFQSGSGRSSDRSSGVPSTSGADTELLTSEDEVVRLLSCSDHYSALGMGRYENIDVSSLKREYRRKAMLVHPDKNMGNEKAAEAFKKLQNAYEVLLDTLKRKTYDDELRREELLDYIRRFQSAPQKNGRHGIFRSAFNHFKPEDEGSPGESRRIACKKCSGFHIWTRTERSKPQARWCQNCEDFHQAKDGDGWVEVEQSFQMLLFGLFQKMDSPRAYVCAESRIYDATEWFVCQRRGRAGRVQSGECYHLYPRCVHDAFADYQLPELLRTPLQSLCLQIKTLRLGTISEFLSRALQSPEPLSVQNAIEYLKIIGALNEKEELTVLGRHLAMLPVEPKLGKMLILGAILNCLDPVLTVVAGLSARDPFLAPFDKKDLADSAKAQFSCRDYSDHLALVRAYDGWKDAERERSGYEYCWKNFLSSQTLKAIDSLRKQFQYLLRDTGLVDENFSTCNKWSRDENLVRAVLCAGLYPGICSVMNKEKSISLKTMEDGQVMLYSNSVNGREARIPYPWLVFNEKVKVNSVFLRDSTAVSDSVLLLFGGNVSRGGLDGHSKMLGGYLEFFMKPDLASTYLNLKPDTTE